MKKPMKIPAMAILLFVAIIFTLGLQACRETEAQETVEWRYWTAVGDNGSDGLATSYDMRRYHEPITEANWHQATPVEGMPAPSLPGQKDSVQVTIGANEVVYFRIVACDERPNCGALSNQVEVDNYPPAQITDLH